MARALVERYGDVFTLRFPGSEPMVFLADPDLVKAVWTREISSDGTETGDALPSYDCSGNPTGDFSHGGPAADAGVTHLVTMPWYFYAGPGVQSAVAFFPAYPFTMRAVALVVLTADRPPRVRGAA